ncbi:cyclin-like protein, partial [Ramicandelaber brevisporus]
SKTQWHFSNDDIRHTPSILDGSAMAQQQQPQQGTGSAPGSSSSLNSLSLQPVDAEKLLRTKGCYAVLRVGMMLKLPIDTIATACTLLHRYYMRRSFKFSNYYLISATSIFVACKIEETPRKLHDVIIYIAQRSLKNDRLWLEVASKEYQNWQNNILACESDLLDKCCFDMEMDHPHTYMVQLCKQLGIRRRFAIRAWAFVCDSLLTTLCLTHSPRVVAMASLLMAI